MALSQLPVSIMEATLFSGIVYFMVGFHMNWAYFLIFWGVIASSNLCLSSLFRCAMAAGQLPGAQQITAQHLVHEKRREKHATSLLVLNYTAELLDCMWPAHCQCVCVRACWINEHCRNSTVCVAVVASGSWQSSRPTRRWQRPMVAWRS